ncbi:unnamed protein product [Bursaphelenchus xylophilus]|uniref:(pine wood nematode) hypothetical protein n=1 Tax=Bursaphelenchus xylophilus TaxID=6326 RepID=A0A1I7RTD0_BURXY|nr:unnamed protein product [Bursaphelenchus xylophilus]CAG9122498.1 unnamed protein product [Bursaphelenchus xylophilus]
MLRFGPHFPQLLAMDKTVSSNIDPNMSLTKMDGVSDAPDASTSMGYQYHPNPLLYQQAMAYGQPMFYPYAPGFPYEVPQSLINSNLNNSVSSPKSSSPTDNSEESNSPPATKTRKIVVNRLTKVFNTEEEKKLYEERRAKNNAAARESRKRRATRESMKEAENEQLKQTILELQGKLAEAKAELKVMRLKVGESLTF